MKDSTPPTDAVDLDGPPMADRAAARPVEQLLKPSEVAALFRVDPKTVTRWAASGRLSSIRTPGGHRRYRRSEVYALLDGSAS